MADPLQPLHDLNIGEHVVQTALDCGALEPGTPC
jgi:hypothetical protein